MFPGAVKQLPVQMTYSQDTRKNTKMHHSAPFLKSLSYSCKWNCPNHSKDQRGKQTGLVFLRSASWRNKWKKTGSSGSWKHAEECSKKGSLSLHKSAWKRHFWHCLITPSNGNVKACQPPPKKHLEQKPIKTGGPGVAKALGPFCQQSPGRESQQRSCGEAEAKKQRSSSSSSSTNQQQQQQHQPAAAANARLTKTDR